MRFAVLIAALGLFGCNGEPAHRTVEDAKPVNSQIALREAAAPSPPAPSRASIYTDLNETSCRLIEENRNEGPYWRRGCPGASGYTVEWTESDLRQGLEIIAKDGKRTGLNLSAVVAKGAFNSLGPRIEWRGADAAKPETLTVRVFVANGAEPFRPDRSMLTVASLNPKPCLIAIVEPGPSQSDEARRIADGPSRPCLTEN